MLRFGTAGLRGPLQDGPDGMNVDTVLRASAGLAEWLRGRCLSGGVVIVGRDARHGSAEFAAATAEVFAAAGFSVLVLPRPLPTPVVAFAVRALRAVAGVQITASHNPATDNGYKVYLDGGAQLIPPADAEIEACIAAVREPISRADPAPTAPAPAVLSLPAETTVAELGEEIVRRYLARVAALPRILGGPDPVRTAAETGADQNPMRRSDLRIALTPMHGVGGELAVAALHAAGFTDVHVVAEQFAPDPDFPTVAFPNPEEPGAADLLLALADEVGADLAIALDPDADRCAIGVRGPHGRRMLRGDETGVLLGDFVLRTAPPDALVATTIVSSRLLGTLAHARGARYAETLTGFKWLARAGDGMTGSGPEAAAEHHHAGPPDMPQQHRMTGSGPEAAAEHHHAGPPDMPQQHRMTGSGPEAAAEHHHAGPPDMPQRHGMVYAYEEAIGHCVDPAAVRDKDGISAAVAAAELTVRLRAQRRGLLDLLDDYALEFGLHAGDQVSLRLVDQAAAAQIVAQLRQTPPDNIAGEPVTSTDMAQVRGAMRTDALIFQGASQRIVVRPSGTEPKLKCYLEVVEPVSSRAALPAAKQAAAQRLTELRKHFENL